MSERDVKLVVYVGGILIVFLLSYFLVYPSVLKIKEIQKEIKIAEKTLESKKATLEKAKKLYKEYNERKADLEKMNQLLSPEPDIIFQLIQFEALTLNNGMELENISFGSLGTSEKGVGIFPVSLKIKGDYPHFKNYLEALAKNLNLIDVKTISFGSSKEGEEGVYSFSLKVNTYTEKTPETRTEKKTEKKTEEKTEKERK